MYALDCFSGLVLEVLEIGQSLIVHGDECVGRQQLGVSMSYSLLFLPGCETRNIYLIFKCYMSYI